MRHTEPNPRNITEQAMNIARHIHKRPRPGLILIIADRPPIFLSVLRKQLSRLARSLQRSDEDTLKQSIEALKLEANPPHDKSTSGIFVISPHETTSHPVACSLLFLSGKQKSHPKDTPSHIQAAEYIFY